jgi:phosphoserine/homoserine phosphotransferase
VTSRCEEKEVMHIVCLDLESIIIPEIWIAVAEATGIPELHLTTRDVPDYRKLMDNRLRILRTHKHRLKDVQQVIQSIQPFSGAVSFLNWVRTRFPTLIVTDSYYEFIMPMMEKLGYPTVLCNSLEINEQGYIVNYKIRQSNGKAMIVKALKALNFMTVAIGDSYNDIAMLEEAEKGILFRPSENIREEFSQFVITKTYGEVKNELLML